MKKLLFLALLPVLFSCSEIVIFPDPVAEFITSTEDQGMVTITTTSEDYQPVRINWGDGTIEEKSGFKAATHQYASDGNYTIELTAFNDKKSKSTTATSNVEIDNTYGLVSIVLTKDISASSLTVGYKLNGGVNAIGQIAARYNGDKNLDCSSVINVVSSKAGGMAKLKPGTYTIVAYSSPSGAGYWEFEITVTNGDCVIRYLV